MNSKIYFCSFSDSRLEPTLNRIASEAIESNFFDQIFIFNEFSLNKEFRREFKKYLKYKFRGYGYWIWKISIIQDVLFKMRDGDILLYTDAGCTINKNGLVKFKKYIDIVKKSELGILAISLQSSHSESKYTKGDLFDYFLVRDNEKIYSTPQIQAGIILIEKNNNSTNFFKTILSVYKSNMDLVNDSPSKSPNFNNYITHRHDQSVFSILFKLNSGVSIPLSEVWTDSIDFKCDLNDSPIWYSRKKNRKIHGIKYLISNWIKHLLNFN